MISNHFQLRQHKNDIDEDKAAEGEETNDEKDEKESMHEIPPWDDSFLTMAKHDLFEMILAASYLELPTLLGLASLKVAKQLGGMTPKEITAVIYFSCKHSTVTKYVLAF